MKTGATKAVFWSLAACSLLGVACSSDKRRQISGKVTFEGKPVPRGAIYFTPDGTVGGQGVGTIIDGKYKTKPDFNVELGTNKVTIKSIDQSGGSLFPEYNTTVVIDSNSNVLNFEVPSEKDRAAGN
jgi:hypothetical protein